MTVDTLILSCGATACNGSALSNLRKGSQSVRSQDWARYACFRSQTFAAHQSNPAAMLTGSGDVPLLFTGGENNAAQERSNIGAFSRAAATANFHSGLHHSCVPFGQIVGEGHGARQSLSQSAAHKALKSPADAEDFGLGRASAGRFSSVLAAAANIKITPWLSELKLL